MTKNGFFHPRPNDEDLWISEELRAQLGTSCLNGHVENPHFEGSLWVGTVMYKQKGYRALSHRRGADTSWEIIAEDPLVPVGEDTAFLERASHL